MTSTTGNKHLLFISMLGETEHFNPVNFTCLCTTGLEKDWIADLFGELSNRHGFDIAGVDICRGDKLPEVESVDCVILGGTMHVIDEDRPWLHDLSTWLQKYRRTSKPLLGVCGGHQLISTKFDGGALKGRSSGTLAGTYAIELTERGKHHPLFKNFSKKPTFNFANYLHVNPVKIPRDGILATHGESKAICIDHGGNWFTTQFHPESTKTVWTCMYEKSNPEFVSNYSDEQDGPKLIENFLALAKAQLETPQNESTQGVKK